MRFISTTIAGTYLIEPELISDARGSFARSFCQNEFTNAGLNPNLVQCSISFNKQRGTLRGMHYQEAPFAEAKLVRCTQGAIYDAIIDLRKDSMSFGKWYGIELTSKNRKALYVPEGCAHGFLTLQDNTEVFYQMSEFYHPEWARGIRYNDPAFSVDWPANIVQISDRDAQYPDYVTVMP